MKSPRELHIIRLLLSDFVGIKLTEIEKVIAKTAWLCKSNDNITIFYSFCLKTQNLKKELKQLSNYLCGYTNIICLQWSKIEL